MVPQKVKKTPAVFKKPLILLLTKLVPSKFCLNAIICSSFMDSETSGKGIPKSRGGRYRRMLGVSVEGDLLKAIDHDIMWNKEIISLPMCGGPGDGILLLQNIVLEIKKTANKNKAQYIQGDKRLEKQYERLQLLQSRNNEIECWYAICFYDNLTTKENKEQWKNTYSYRFFAVKSGEPYVMKQKDGLTYSEFKTHTKKDNVANF